MAEEHYADVRPRPPWRDVRQRRRVTGTAGADPDRGRVMDDPAALAALAGCNTEPLYEHVDLHPPTSPRSTGCAGCGWRDERVHLSQANTRSTRESQPICQQFRPP